MLGDGDKKPAPGEAETAALVRRSWHAARDIPAGTVLSPDDLVLKRPADGLAPDACPVGCHLAVALLCRRAGAARAFVGRQGRVSRILSVSSSRADIGALAPVWRALAATAGVELHVFLTGMHKMDDSAARAALPAGAVVHHGGADLGGGSPVVAAAAMGRIEADAGTLLGDLRPDLVLVMGDRLDMLPAATATLPFNLPLAHLHGGEITEGAVDDRIRHALSKLAHVHCVSTQGARQRLLAMGIDDAAIHVTGAPGLDTLLAAPAMSAAAFAHEAGLDGIDGDLAALRLVTVHPETNAADPLAAFAAVAAALDARPAPTLFTAPNSDPGGADIRRLIEAFVARHRLGALSRHAGRSTLCQRASPRRGDDRQFVERRDRSGAVRFAGRSTSATVRRAVSAAAMSSMCRTTPTPLVRRSTGSARCRCASRRRRLTGTARRGPGWRGCWLASRASPIRKCWAAGGINASIDA